jgi:hypothetical protein
MMPKKIRKRLMLGYLMEATILRRTNRCDKASGFLAPVGALGVSMCLFLQLVEIYVDWTESMLYASGAS